MRLLLRWCCATSRPSISICPNSMSMAVRSPWAIRLARPAPCCLAPPSTSLSRQARPLRSLRSASARVWARRRSSNECERRRWKRVMNLKNFRFETDKDGIALLTWDMPGRSMNVITPEVIDEIDKTVDHVVSEVSIKGCVITSGKETFSGGADLSMLQNAAADYQKVRAEKGEEEAAKRFLESAGRLSQVY